MALKIGDIEEGLLKERKRFESYKRAFVNSRNPYIDKIVPIIEFTREKEEEIYKDNRDILIQGHGDFHPKNIIIGQDKMHDISTLFISVIDFDSSGISPRAFDIGYFLSQFYYQFSKFPHVIDSYKESHFVDSYLEDIKGSIDDFHDQITLFKIRANLSIASYLIKVGKGQSPEVFFIIQQSMSLMESLEK